MRRASRTPEGAETETGPLPGGAGRVGGSAVTVEKPLASYPLQIGSMWAVRGQVADSSGVVAFLARWQSGGLIAYGLKRVI